MGHVSKRNQNGPKGNEDALPPFMLIFLWEASFAFASPKWYEEDVGWRFGEHRETLPRYTVKSQKYRELLWQIW